MKSILRNPTRKEKRSAHKRACSAAGMTTDFIAELSAVSRMERLARIWHEGTYRSGRLSDVPYVEHPADVDAEELMMVVRLYPRRSEIAHRYVIRHLLLSVVNWAFPSLACYMSYIMENLRQRVDPKTGLVRPFTAHMAREFGVSRSSVSRELRSLREYGAVERVDVHESPKTLTIYYRLKD